ncbi:DNA repair protein RecN [Anaerocolumna cellulosilytica]|uniref:DNA repair protein RecN n=1 Tax=Anaerocolumna cellulosilytica TaxID=433286 RepID=A0A6S6R887_9FIRM|nr:DNA repair protein RecN [Anaerocolumna cellulosilytica]MBB5196590.1 DNA repair protein RecN (Recombination protein N) [Anaerocolumna cellulosilytica]BCJ95690.1 DNA repair protein RecN [Anaerocolumna cellulosilytica]
MLLNLHVKNFAIIDEVDVTFRDNLNILTGETGAGKSIIIGSVNVALGGKVSKDIIRKGADYALVELLFHTDNDYILNRIKELDLPVEDGQIIITRKIMSGKSISKVNGETVTAANLKEIAGLLIDIHGQHEHQSLLYKDKHLDIIDRFAKENIYDIKNNLEVEYRKYIDIGNSLKELKIDEDKRLREMSFLEYEINEIKNAALKSGEDEILTADYKKFSNAKTIAEGLNQVYDLIGYENLSSAGNNIGRSVKQLSRLTEYDETIKGFYSQIMDIETLVNDFNRDLSDYIADINGYEDDFTITEQRLNLVNHLKAKYGSSIEEILQYLKSREEKLTQYENYEETLSALNLEYVKQEEKVRKLSEQLSVIRQEKSKELASKIKEALIDLNFLEVKFEIIFRYTGHYTGNGYDDAEFIISTNPGEELKPLSKVASGGELSRIMLAIKSVLAHKDEINTLIFDEIDVGVSGRTAQKVSEKLSMIADKHQILCITHLPQIAAMADAHYIIEKQSDGITTHTSIRSLKEKESVEEIARILGGAKITDTVIQSAEEMKELAKRTKKY